MYILIFVVKVPFGLQSMIARSKRIHERGASNLAPRAIS